jgi:hypothetical protein
VDNWKNITNSQNSVRKRRFGGTFSFSTCHIKWLDNGSLVLNVFEYILMSNNKTGLMFVYLRSIIYESMADRSELF